MKGTATDGAGFVLNVEQLSECVAPGGAGTAALGAVPSSGEMITSPSKLPHHNTHP